MLERYSFIPVFAGILGGLAWWSTQVGPTLPTRHLAGENHQKRALNLTLRQELLEVMDGIVAHEHYYHSVYGRYTNLLPRVGVTIPPSISHVYDLRITEVHGDRFKVSAMAERGGDLPDLVTIDQNYEVTANFDLPPPRAQFLQTRALRHLKALRDAPQGQAVEEHGIFKGYFNYSVNVEPPHRQENQQENHQENQTTRKLKALGVRVPVMGVILEFNENDQILAESDSEYDLSRLLDLENQALGQKQGSSQNLRQSTRQSILSAPRSFSRGDDSLEIEPLSAE